MVKFGISGPSGVGGWVEVDRDVLANTLNRWKTDSEYVNYDASHAAGYYHDAKFLKIDVPNTYKNLPYQIEFDYRDISDPKGWGVAFPAGEYSFPNELMRHKEKCIDEFTKKGRLSKGNNPAPRVNSFQVVDGLPRLGIQKATYYDQVGTNLTIDRVLVGNRLLDVAQDGTLRAWDIAQANKAYSLPSFEESRLANTIGVGVAITVRDERGHKYIFQRRRGKKVAVYRNMWHLPFSFSLFFNFDDFLEEGLAINKFIEPDFYNELSAEVGIERSRFKQLRPLAFCRDLARGGKPQFFCELESTLTMGELKNSVKDTSGEFIKKPSFSRRRSLENLEDMSPELAAAKALLQSE